MNESETDNRKNRRYPGVYEKGIPMILVGILVFIAILVGIAFAVIFHII